MQIRHRTRERLSRVISQLTEPHPSIVDEDRRYIAHLIASVLLAMMVITLLFIIVPLIIDFSRYEEAATVVSVLGLGMLSISYALSRSPKFYRGAALAISSAFVLVYLFIMPNPDYAIRLYRYLVFPLLLSGFFMPFRFTLALSGINLLAGLIFGFSLPSAFWFDFAYGYLFVGLTSVLLLVFIRNRESIENKRRATVTANATAYRKLAEQHAATNRHLQGVLSQLDGVFVRLDSEMRTAAQSLTDARDATIKSMRQHNEFISNVNHEIRTPMTGIIGMLELLNESQLDELQKEYVSIGYDSAKKLLHILDDMLDISRMESGQFELEIKPVNLRALYADIQTILMPQWSRANLTFSVHIAADVPEIVYGDPIRLRQVMMNLAGNAVKFTHIGGVELHLELIERDGSSAKLRFSVNDTGIGIRTDQMEHVFESFVQADSSTTRRYGGTGLGLTIARQLVHMMKGEIVVNSRIGIGSRFAFELSFLTVPPTEQSCNQPPEHDVQAAALSLTAPSNDQQRILLVEDNATNRQFIASILTALGITVDEASNGEVALEYTRQVRYDLILMDVHMPLMDGIETTRRLRATNQPSATAPILALTASAMPDEHKQYLAAGMNGVLNKPFTIDELRSTVFHWLRARTPSEAMS